MAKTLLCFAAFNSQLFMFLLMCMLEAIWQLYNFSFLKQLTLISWATRTDFNTHTNNSLFEYFVFKTIPSVKMIDLTISAYFL